MFTAIIIFVAISVSTFNAVKVLFRILKSLKSEFEMRKADGFSRENLKFIATTLSILIIECSLLSMAYEVIENEALGLAAIGISIMSVLYNKKLYNNIIELKTVEEVL